MVPGEHASEEALERYCLGQVTAAELETLESHLLVCPVCQDQLRETESYVRTMQQATAQVAAEQLVRTSRWEAFRNWFFRSVPVAAIAGAAALVIVWGVAPSFRGSPVAVRLEVSRGDENPRAQAPANRPLLLTLDVTGLAELDSYQVRMVDAGGGAVFSGSAKRSRGRVDVAAPVRLPAGTYWVRLHDPARPRTTLREYGLDLQ